MSACEPSPCATRRAIASCCASFGELLQGVLPGAGHFLVTLPIDLSTRAHFSVPSGAAELRVHPSSSWKVRALLAALLSRHCLPMRGELVLESAIPAGKGLSSSTADLVAAYRAVTAYHNLDQNTPELETLLREIEPSDGVMHDGIVAYLHRDVRLHEALGPPPPLCVVALDEGGEVDTLAHNRRALAHSSVEVDEYAELFAQLKMALRSRDVVSIGAVATRSAQLNQRLLPKRWLDSMRSIATAVRAAGVVIAHSGTYIGILLDALAPDHDRQVIDARGSLLALGLVPKIFHTIQSANPPQVSHA